MGIGIQSLADLQPGDIMFGPIGGAIGLGVGLGQLALGEAFRAGRVSIRHVGIVVEASQALPPGSVHEGVTYETGVITRPRLVQAMPSGAEEVPMMVDTHWTDRHAYARLMPDYAGQGEDAALIARLMVKDEVAYSFASYAALALWRWGIKTPKLEAWIGRRQESAYHMPVDVTPNWRGPGAREVRLPREAICSVLADQAWSLTGKRVMSNVAHQAVTPGAMANELWRRRGTVWGGPGFLPNIGDTL